ncbi:MAG: alpha-ketoglutarate decarboxylase [Gemmatimonadales bacterium]|nr:MAG: alpha-ketoglutarate decarboxylase [Gemmatimonadales bacterium]
MFENIFETVNSGFAQALYEDYLRDPNSVPAAWRELFENGLKGMAPVEVPRQAAETPAKAGGPRVPYGSLEPIRGSALRLLENMQASLAVPTATSYREVDVTRLWNARAELNRRLESKGIKLSFTHLIGWAIVKAAQRLPVMTHAVVEEDGQYWRWDPESVNLGIAVDLEGKDGRRRLMVPVLKQAQEADFAGFYREYERLIAGAREGTLPPDAYFGATITLTNPGTIGTSASVPRLMKGQGSIIATGAIREVAGVRVMTVSSTYDHRIIQGAESGMFLRELDRMLQGEDGFYEEVAASLGAGQLSLTPQVVAAPLASRTAAAPVSEEMLFHVAAAMSVVKHHRTHGYLAARLDPLGTEPIGDPALDPASVGLTPEIMARIPAAVLRVYVEGETMADILPRLREVYCGTIAYEIEHIASHEQRVWLREVIERGRHRTPLSNDEKRALLELLTRVEGLEQFLHRSYLGQKRFGIEGLDMLVPMLREAIDLAAEQGAKDVDMGMAHRGRLNVLAHILGIPYKTIIKEFEGGIDVDTLLTSGRTGDVKYHHGATGEYTTSSGKVVEVSLMPNPSHLEAVDPVVEGAARAEQTDRSGPQAKHDPSSVLPILIHGDAAFAAQGVVAETFNLARLPGYSTGGTLHIIANNQIGFTTTPSEARSTDFASDLAKGFDVPIIHVNADDPEACIAAVRLAMMYRQKFAGDVVINLVGYRRHGHNEADEPRYTQPAMYRIIDRLPTVRERYARSLIGEGVVTEEEVVAMRERVERELNEIREAVKGEPPVEARVSESALLRQSGQFAAEHEPETRVGADLLRELNEELLRVPDGFKVNPKLRRQLERRREAVANGGRLDWAHAEALAFASLLVEGIPLRLSGQDSVRGTFSQRHLTLFDAETGEPYTPIQHLSKARAPFELYNSPLSEYAVLGFEYGYSVEAPEALVMWEAQFGDFANGAEVIIDQFVIAGLSKWGQTSRLTLLLPHGYEGQGPEHSSARLERYLALGAENNIRVANCSTPAQYFHLLRRQAKHQELRPLVLMTPKSLLRLPEASSTMEELATGRFEYVLDDPTLPAGREAVRKLVLCSGKVYYDAITSPLRKTAAHVALGRVELLYPFPYDAVRRLIESYPNLERIVWLQEEPRNMGARKFVVPKIAEVTDLPIDHVSRPERASPAEGYPAVHQREQERLVAEALG